MTPLDAILRALGPPVRRDIRFDAVIFERVHPVLVWTFSPSATGRLFKQDPFREAAFQHTLEYPHT